MTTDRTETNASSAAQSWRERRKALRRKRGRDDDDDDDENNTDENGIPATGGGGGGEYVPYTSAAQRIRMEREAALLAATGGGVSGGGEGGAEGERARGAKSRKLLAAVGGGGGFSDLVGSTKEEEDIEGDRGGAPAKDEGGRPSKNEEPENGEGSKKKEGPKEEEEEDADAAATSLLEAAAALKSQREALSESERAELARKEEEQRILREASQVQTNALQAASELAKGVVYRDSLRTSWTCPRRILAEGEDSWKKIRDKWHILVEGDDCPPPMKNFPDMKFPRPILDSLRERNIKRPTPIQMQGLPVALSGRDMVGIAFTGSGKTMTFSLPLVMAALEEEVRMPLIGGEGPVGFILAPSRELARQTFDVVKGFCTTLGTTGEYPPLRAQLLIGGENARDQLEPIKEKGVHCIVATPGRMRDFLKRKSITLDICRYICLDEADRMLDLGFDEEVGEIMNHFTHQRQTLLFSATFPKKFQDFAKNTLVKPIVVNVGRAGAANLDVIQEVEYVKQEAKIVYLLECLQKTAPPVVIFCERKGDVDDIHEYLLLKGVEAVSIHGGKDQAERNEAIALYKAGSKDVLVATDVAAKGLDFADIQHVINFDMPAEIENYVHRIGRTGRCGKTGVATTFINKSCEETTLLDLKHLLKEAHQRIPPVLMIMDDPQEQVAAAAAGEDGTRGCSFCGGLGHSIVDCPKIDKDARRVAGGHKDAIASGDGYGGDW